MPVDLVVIGGGRMGEALVGGALGSGWAHPDAVVVVERDEGRRRELADGLVRRYPGLTVSAEIPSCTGAIVAVKPADVEEACGRLAEAGVVRVLSIAAGVRLERLEHWLRRDLGGEHPTVLRAMPNTPALIGAGAAALSPGRGAGPDDVAWASGLLASVGTVTEVAEPYLDAVTGLSGSGPAYVFLLVEALIDAGVFLGLPRPTAQALAVQTLLGSARLLAESGDGPELLRAGVTSPGGTTAAGLRALEAAGFRTAVVDAVLAATERARELGA
jgi:pyrroline-5-carboxylate reductase